jgi:hypothetical protein
MVSYLTTVEVEFDVKKVPANIHWLPRAPKMARKNNQINVSYCAQTCSILRLDVHEAAQRAGRHIRGVLPENRRGSVDKVTSMLI